MYICINSISKYEYYGSTIDAQHSLECLWCYYSEVNHNVVSAVVSGPAGGAI